MVTFDVTDSSFINASIGETNQWLSSHIGELEHDQPEQSYGAGWFIAWNNETRRWIITIDDPHKATIFALRWL